MDYVEILRDWTGCMSKVRVETFCCVKNIWATSRQNQQTDLHPEKTQISLGICPVWSETSLCAQWVAKDPSILRADSEDSDQTGRMPRLIRVFTGRTVILLILSWGSSFHEWILYHWIPVWIQTLLRYVVVLAMSWRTTKPMKLCAPGNDSDQPVHLRSLIKVFAECCMDSKEPSILSCRQRKILIRLCGWADWSEFSLVTCHFVCFAVLWLVLYEPCHDLWPGWTQISLLD